MGQWVKPLAVQVWQPVTPGTHIKGQLWWFTSVATALLLWYEAWRSRVSYLDYTAQPQKQERPSSHKGEGKSDAPELSSGL